MSIDRLEAIYNSQLETLVELGFIRRAEAPPFTPLRDGVSEFGRVLLVLPRYHRVQIREIGVGVHEPRKLDAYLNWIRDLDKSPYLVWTQEREEQMRGVDNSGDLPPFEHAYGLAEGLALLRTDFALDQRLVLRGATFKSRPTGWPDAVLYIRRSQTGLEICRARYPLARNKNSRVPTYMRPEAP